MEMYMYITCLYNHIHISTAYVVAHNKLVCMEHIAKANLCNPHVIYNQIRTMHTVIKSKSSEIHCIYIYNVGVMNKMLAN